MRISFRGVTVEIDVGAIAKAILLLHFLFLHA